MLGWLDGWMVKWLDDLMVLIIDIDMSFLKVEDLEVYKIAFNMSKEIYDIVIAWSVIDKIP